MNQTPLRSWSHRAAIIEESPQLIQQQPTFTPSLYQVERFQTEGMRQQRKPQVPRVYWHGLSGLTIVDDSKGAKGTL